MVSLSLLQATALRADANVLPLLDEAELCDMDTWVAMLQVRKLTYRVKKSLVQLDYTRAASTYSELKGHCRASSPRTHTLQFGRG